MALNFPDSPSEGQTYQGFVYDSTSDTWAVRQAPVVGWGAGSGGTEVTFSDGGVDWKAHIFKTSGTFTCSTAGKLEYLVVGGGGAGQSGAGGAGGCNSGIVIVSAGAITVTVGSGGTVSGGGFSNSGDDSRFGNEAALGGGGGGASGVPPARGGSGGGSERTGPQAVGLFGQGRNGNASFDVKNAGGGGAEAVGGEGSRTPSVGGDGGIGRVVNIVTTTVATAQSVGEVSGSSVYWSGGGAGSGTTNGTPGLGGGGAVGSPGSPNTGGGGSSAQAGGSGIVIVRYVV